MGFSESLDRYFKITERGSNVTTEVRAGVASFLTMSYNLLVNPQIMSKCGIPVEDVVVATAAASCVASVLVGLFGNLPFGLAPGMGLSAYLTFGLVVGGDLTRVQALTSCLVSGALVAVVTLTGISHFLMRITPHHVKLAIVVGMGLLIALIGMVEVDLVVSSGDESLVALGDLSDWKIWLVMSGLLLIGTLTYHQIEGGILIGIMVCTLTYFSVTGEWPKNFVEVPRIESAFSENVDLSSLDSGCIMPIFAFVFVALFDISGVMYGLGSLAKLESGPAGLPGGIWGFLGSAVGTAIAAALGCSPIIVQVENAAGIKEGGRTGLTACVVGALFAASLFLAPLFGQIPNAATAPVLILVGAMMTNESKHIDWHNMKATLPAFLCIAMMPFTYSIPNGILFGMLFSFAFFFTSGEAFERCRGLGRRAQYAPLDAGGGSGDGGGVSAFFDDTQLKRNPSLLVSKREADEAEAAAGYGAGAASVSQY
ncbi:xanthine/uracil/vitamin C permease [Tribonema minus]|uniref:Xanthine/uracil/vitamin C permease n=1 Tax=Tribonema minus TaxID=303371 RepID=A0A835YIE4_9STRA|nr:xanthine/uracil/vitamin C permease [Tribonema minus]